MPGLDLKGPLNEWFPFFLKKTQFTARNWKGTLCNSLSPLLSCLLPFPLLLHLSPFLPFLLLHFLSFCKINANLLIGFGNYSLKNTTLNCSGNVPPVFPPESAPLILWTEFLAFGLFSRRFLASGYLQTVPLVLALRPVWELCVSEKVFCCLGSVHLTSLLYNRDLLIFQYLLVEVLPISQRPSSNNHFPRKKPCRCPGRNINLFFPSTGETVFVPLIRYFCMCWAL